MSKVFKKIKVKKIETKKFKNNKGEEVEFLKVQVEYSEEIGCKMELKAKLEKTVGQEVAVCLQIDENGKTKIVDV